MTVDHLWSTDGLLFKARGLPRNIYPFPLQTLAISLLTFPHFTFLKVPKLHSSLKNLSFLLLLSVLLISSSFSLLSPLFFDRLLALLLDFEASITATSGIMPRVKKMATTHSYGMGSADAGSSRGSRRPSARPPSELKPIAPAPPPSTPQKLIPPRYVNFGEITPLFLMICEMVAHQGWISFFSSH